VRRVCVFVGLRALLQCLLWGLADCTQPLFAGIGKSNLIRTAFHHEPSVVFIQVDAALSGTEIVALAMLAVARLNLGVPAEASALRVIWWHRRLFMHPITMVIGLSERDKYAQATSAVRRLSNLGLFVVLDASPNSLHPGTTATNRERVIDVGPMPLEQTEGDPEFSALPTELNDAGCDLKAAAVALFGNSPSQLHALVANVQHAGDVRAGLEGFMTQEMSKACDKFALL
jgi:hypothetical protein